MKMQIWLPLKKCHHFTRKVCFYTNTQTIQNDTTINQVAIMILSVKQQIFVGLYRM